jgi:hypothetical protein
MRDDFEGPVWATHHQQLSRQIGEAIDKLAYAFRRLSAIQYDAPWRRRPARSAGCE